MSSQLKSIIYIYSTSTMTSNTSYSDYSSHNRKRIECNSHIRHTNMTALLLTPASLPRVTLELITAGLSYVNDDFKVLVVAVESSFASNPMLVFASWRSRLTIRMGCASLYRLQFPYLMNPCSGYIRLHRPPHLHNLTSEDCAKVETGQGK